MRELIEEGHVYIAAPPLYLVKRNKKEYAWNDAQRDQANERMGAHPFNDIKVWGDECRTIMGNHNGS
jgi:DNA gyrase/topoisomerase IV subunit B